MAIITVRPSKVQAGRSAYQRLFLTLAAASWTGGTTFTISRVSGVTKVGQIVEGGAQAYVVITTTTAALTPQILTVSDGTNSGTVIVGPVAPTHRRWFSRLDHRNRI